MLVIDGYNLIKRHLSAFRHLPDLEAQRDHLLKLLHSSPALRGQKIVVVFDGSEMAPARRKISFRNIEIVFSGGHRNADQVIQALIRQRAAREDLEVVTSDREIQRTARDHGATVWGAEQFWQKLHTSTVSEETEAPAFPDRELSDPEVQEWMKLFENRSQNEDDID